MSIPSPVTPRLSAAVMLLRSPHDGDGLEVFMVRRPVQSEFAPDVYVFPGGSCHLQDSEAEVTPGVVVPIETDKETELGTGVRVAAIRELFEEAGVLLAMQDSAQLRFSPEDSSRFADYRRRIQQGEMTLAEMTATEDIVLATDALTYCAHWITPEAFPKRFETFFFLAEHPSVQLANHDAIETIDGVWIAPKTALAKHDAGEFPLVFATIRQLQDLALFATPAEAIAAWRGRVPRVIMPKVIQDQGKQVILMPDEPAPA